MPTEHFQEQMSMNFASIDRARSVIRGVKILGLESRNGRTYPLATLQRAAGLYEGARVNVDHPAKPGEVRSYADRFGSLSDVNVKPTGLYGNLSFNPKHSLAEQFLWDAENCPTNCGLSHNVIGAVVTKNGRKVVESIDKVLSVDLVADPATVGGLFEGVRRDHSPIISAKNWIDSDPGWWGSLR